MGKGIRFVLSAACAVGKFAGIRCGRDQRHVPGKLCGRRGVDR